MRTFTCPNQLKVKRIFRHWNIRKLQLLFSFCWKISPKKIMVTHVNNSKSSLLKGMPIYQTQVYNSEDDPHSIIYSRVFLVPFFRRTSLPLAVEPVIWSESEVISCLLLLAKWPWVGHLSEFVSSFTCRLKGLVWTKCVTHSNCTLLGFNTCHCYLFLKTSPSSPYPTPPFICIASSAIGQLTHFKNLKTRLTENSLIM